jgi:hypothetical protein
MRRTLLWQLWRSGSRANGAGSDGGASRREWLGTQACVSRTTCITSACTMAVLIARPQCTCARIAPLEAAPPSGCSSGSATSAAAWRREGDAAVGMPLAPSIEPSMCAAGVAVLPMLGAEHVVAALGGDAERMRLRAFCSRRYASTPARAAALESGRRAQWWQAWTRAGPMHSATADGARVMYHMWCGNAARNSAQQHVEDHFRFSCTSLPVCAPC